MSYKDVRIKVKTHTLLKRVANREGRNLFAVVHRAIVAYLEDQLVAHQDAGKDDTDILKELDGAAGHGP